MKFALIDGLKMLPAPKLHGKCPFCSGKVISKCGDIKLWHWAHCSKRDCDIWWENESLWHRTWKDCFPTDWQEIIQLDKSGEKHIADVKTVCGWVLEFQHSYLKPEERKTRNAFYDKLVWVIDGLRRSRDQSQFFKLLKEESPIYRRPYIWKIWLDDCTLLKEWSGNHGPVLFDFGKDTLWCLLPVEQNMSGYVAAFPRRQFIGLHNKLRDQTKNFDDLLGYLNELASQLERELSLQVPSPWKRHRW